MANEIFRKLNKHDRVNNNTMMPLAQTKILPLGQKNLQIYSFHNRKAVNIRDAALVLGHHEDWLATMMDTPSKWLEQLKNSGYIDDRQHVTIKEKNGESIHTVISLQSFRKLIVQESIDGNVTALVLLAALAEIGIETMLGISQQD